MSINLWWFLVLGLLIILSYMIQKYHQHQHTPLVSIAALGFIIGTAILGGMFYQSRKAETNLRVVGYANKLFVSDLVKWNLSLQKNTPIENLNKAYRQMAEDTKAFREYLLLNGIKTEEIDIQPISSNPVHDNYGNIISYNLNQNVMILSPDLENIEKLSLNPEFFAGRGILLQRSSLDYLFTKLPEMKKQLLAEATNDAVSRAKEISAAADTGLGKLKEARAGVFQITEPYSTDVSDYGIYNTSTKQKSISVTLTAVFGIR